MQLAQLLWRDPGCGSRGRGVIAVVKWRRTMRITQGTFSYLPDFTEEKIKAQVHYCFSNGWAFSIEHTDDPHPRNAYWEMWGLPDV